MDGDKRRMPRYTEEFRQDAVDLVFSSDRPIKQVAEDLGINDTTLGNWVRAERKRRRGMPTSPGSGEPAEEEVKRLRKRVNDLEKEREILKRFAAFWVKETNG